ncbi:hypothetical protein EYF80_013863 [Liparis tanakae]|uniref:Uncharacterized protein n=1 Tax=Liparis tanakae TaxID=230148 RepID=A0A4Z2IFK5_9TELE|nr:hypothetical protein EYF80_013863 [Liparis tanakae]
MAASKEAGQRGVQYDGTVGLRPTAMFPRIATIHHPQPVDSEAFLPLGERLMVTSAQFIERPPTLLAQRALTTQLHSPPANLPPSLSLL